RTMLQAAEILITYYPEEYTLRDLEEHIDDLLLRFQNHYLKDTVYRVGNDLPRKLGINDRFAGIIQMAKKKELPYELIVSAMSHGLFFRKSDNNENFNQQDELFLQSLYDKGLEESIVDFCGFKPTESNFLIKELKDQWCKLKKHHMNRMFL